MHDKIKVTYLTEQEETIVVTGKVLSMIPLRNRRLGVITRTSEGMSAWRWRPARLLTVGVPESPVRTNTRYSL